MGELDSVVPAKASQAQALFVTSIAVTEGPSLSPV